LFQIDQNRHGGYDPRVQPFISKQFK
jgi:hypothetical protein